MSILSGLNYETIEGLILPGKRKTVSINHELDGGLTSTKYYDIFYFQVLVTELNLLMTFADSTRPVKDGLYPFHGGKNFH